MTPEIQWTEGHPEGEFTVGAQIMARLDCAGQPWAHLSADEGGWCYMVEEGERGGACWETIGGYFTLTTK